MNLNDLYQQARQDDRSAEGKLFQRLTVMFTAFLRQRGVGTQDTEDIVQNALAKIARLYRHDSRKDNFAAWCQTVLKNQFIDFCRAQTSQKDRQIDLATQSQRLVSPKTDYEVKARLLECLKKLHQANPLHARLINLHYQGYTGSEVSVRLDLSANNCRVIMFRARAMLRACLKKSEASSE